MKLKIHKKSKKILILIFALLLVLSSLQLFFILSAPKNAKTETILYQSNCEPKISYQVFIRPNEVYSGTVLSEGGIYSKKLLDYIKSDFNISYSGSKNVPLDIEYQMLATVNGYKAGNDQNEKIYWSKSFPLTEKKNIPNQEGTWNGKESVAFSLAAYDAFAVRAKDITGMNVNSELLVSMTGKVTAHIGDKNLETPFQVAVQMPLLEDTFQISAKNSDPVQKNIKEMSDSPIKFNKFRFFSYSFLFVISITGLLTMLFFTRDLNPQEMTEKRVNSIIKNYGSRIVALQNIPKMNYRQHYKVHSMKDLIKIADELQKPIFYEADPIKQVKNYEFYVIDNDALYSVFIDQIS